MKVVHLLGGGFSSGAGKAVETIHNQLLNDGIQSHVLGRLEADIASKDDIHRYNFHDRAIAVIGRKVMDTLSIQKYGRKSLKVQKVPQLGSKPQKYKIYKEADIIHIQWIGADTFDKSFWKVLSEETRPVIWTLRDMWVMTGGCYFSADCRGYENECHQCPYLPSQSNISHEEFKFKKSHIPKNTTFLSISYHFKKLADKSQVISQREHRVIFNSVSAPPKLVSKSEARKKLKLSAKRLYLGGGALNLNDPRKGSLTFRHLLQQFSKTDILQWLLFGQNLEQLISPAPSNLTQLGLITSAETLGHIYSASDIFVMPSLQESFGKTTAEAMFSGTPVIAYDNTPAEDMIEHGKTGWLVPHGDYKKFHETLLKAISLKPNHLQQMGEDARAFAEQNFSLDSIAQKHIELYKEKLAR